MFIFKCFDHSFVSSNHLPYSLNFRCPKEKWDEMAATKTERLFPGDLKQKKIYV